jgi:tRNA(fMet)-specific endonuclease VapC
MTFAFMLDLSAVSHALRGRGHVAAHLRAHVPSEVCLSSITLAELRYGADRRSSAKLHALIDAFVGDVAVVSFRAPDAVRYGRLAAALAAVGSTLGQFDTLVAAHALSLGLILVTSNVSHFSDVPDLRTEDWHWASGT